MNGAWTRHQWAARTPRYSTCLFLNPLHTRRLRRGDFCSAVSPPSELPLPLNHRGAAGEAAQNRDHFPQLPHFPAVLRGPFITQLLGFLLLFSSSQIQVLHQECNFWGIFHEIMSACCNKPAWHFIFLLKVSSVCHVLKQFKILLWHFQQENKMIQSVLGSNCHYI